MMRFLLSRKSFGLKLSSLVLAVASLPAVAFGAPDIPPSKLDLDFRFVRADSPPRGNDRESREAAAKKSRSFVRLRQILKAEPTAKDVQSATLRFYKLEPERLSRMGTASRLKGLVPDFEASVDNSLATTLGNLRDGLYPILPNNNPYKEQTWSNTNGITWRVRGTFYLDRLVFNSEELDVRSLNSLEENLVREVTTLYYTRHRLIANLFLSPPESDEQVFYELLRLDEMTSTLDAMTGGMFQPRAWKWEKDMQAADKG